MTEEAFYRVRTYTQIARADDGTFAEFITQQLSSQLELIKYYMRKDPFSEQSCKLQKLSLKMIHRMLSYELPGDVGGICPRKWELVKLFGKKNVFGNETRENLVTTMISIISKDIPQEIQEYVEEHKRPKLVWWKRMKWSLRIILQMLEIYNYNFGLPIIEREVLKILEQCKNDSKYYPPRVIALAAACLSRFALISHHYKLSKPIQSIISTTVFPLACQFNFDSKLWHEEPHTYVKTYLPVCLMSFNLRWPTERRLPKNEPREYLKSADWSLKCALTSLVNAARNQNSETDHILPSYADNFQIHPEAAEVALDVLCRLRCYFPLCLTEFKFSQEVMMRYVLPMLESNNQPLKARVYHVLNEWTRMQAIDSHSCFIIDPASQHAIISILNDAMVVKISAALCLHSFLDKARPMMNDLLLGQAKSVTNILPKLVDIYCHFDIVEVLSLLDTMATIVIPNESEMSTLLIALIDKLIRMNPNEVSKRRNIIQFVKPLASINTMLERSSYTFRVHVLDTRMKQDLLDFIDHLLRLNLELSDNLIIYKALNLLTSPNNNAWHIFDRLCLTIKRNNNRSTKDSNLQGCHGFAYSTISSIIDSNPVEFFNSSTKVSKVLDVCEHGVTNQKDTGNHSAFLLKSVLVKWPLSDEKTALDEHYYIYLRQFITLAVAELIDTKPDADIRRTRLSSVIAAFTIDYRVLLNVLVKKEHEMIPGKGRFLLNTYIRRWLDIVDENSNLDLDDNIICCRVLSLIITMPSSERPEISNDLISGRVAPLSLVVLNYLKKAVEEKQPEMNYPRCTEALVGFFTASIKETDRADLLINSLDSSQQMQMVELVKLALNLTWDNSNTSHIDEYWTDFVRIHEDMEKI